MHVNIFVFTFCYHYHHSAPNGSDDTRLGLVLLKAEEVVLLLLLLLMLLLLSLMIVGRLDANALVKVAGVTPAGKTGTAPGIMFGGRVI